MSGKQKKKYFLILRDELTLAQSLDVELITFCLETTFLCFLDVFVFRLINYIFLTDIVDVVISNGFVFGRSPVRISSGHSV